MSPRPDVSVERKGQILDAASQVFAEKGVHESRMDDIVKKSGFSKGTLYWYFKSKDDILIGIFEQMFQREFQDIEQLQHMEGTATSHLQFLTERVIRDINKMLKLMPIAYEFFSLAFRRKFVQEAFKQYFNAFLDILIPIIQQGIDSEEFLPEDPMEVALALGAIFEGTILLWVYDKTLVKPDQHIRSGINFILAGIKT